MAVKDEFRAGDLRRAFGLIGGVLDEHAEALDSLCGDHESGVGADMAVTFTAALDAAGDSGDLVTMTAQMAQGSGEAASGPSGAALAEFFEALSGVVIGADTLDAQRFALALELAAERLQDDDATPEPGRLRSVVSSASVGALRALDQGLSLAEVIIAASDEGLDELESGLAANPELARDGVVDAGAAGYLLILDSLSAIVTGDALPRCPSTPTRSSPVAGARFVISCIIAQPERESVDAAVWLESLAWLESTWHELGTVNHFSTSASNCRVELDTPDAGRAIEALCAIGMPQELVIRLSETSDRSPSDRSPSDRSPSDGFRSEEGQPSPVRGDAIPTA